MPNIGSSELLLVCAVVLIILFISAMLTGVAFKRRNPALQSTTPLDTLKMRYARGEITQAQFERMKRNLL